MASSLAEVNHPVTCPPQWLPVLLASSSRHVDSPTPRLNVEDLPFEGDDEALSMERRTSEATDLDCGSEENLAASWVCHQDCIRKHFDYITRTYLQPEHANCTASCANLCSPPRTPPSPPWVYSWRSVAWGWWVGGASAIMSGTRTRGKGWRMMRRGLGGGFC